MSWSEQALGGAVLAATVLGDKGAMQGRQALAAPVGEALAVRMARTEGLGPASRTDVLRQLASSLRPAARGDAPLPPRARALLAGEVPRQLGRRWIAEAHPPRRGYAAPASLRSMLRRMASVPVAYDAAVAERERQRGRDVLAALLPDATEATRRQWMQGLGPDAAAFGSQQPAVAPPPDALDVTWLDLALCMAEGAQRVRALGALELGARGELEGDGDSWRWRRIGRQLAEMREAGCLE